VDARKRLRLQPGFGNVCPPQDASVSMRFTDFLPSFLLGARKTIGTSSSIYCLARLCPGSRMKSLSLGVRDEFHDK
jgi:hypothetical protein